MNLKELITKRCEALRISQGKLSRLSGISEQTIGAITRGGSRRISFKTGMALARVLTLEPNTILEAEGKHTVDEIDRLSEIAYGRPNPEVKDEEGGVL